MAPAVPAERLELAASCLFGLEGPLANELRHMGMEDVAPENGRVRFTTDKAGYARLICCETGASVSQQIRRA